MNWLTIITVSWLTVQYYSCQSQKLSCEKHILQSSESDKNITLSSGYNSYQWTHKPNVTSCNIDATFDMKAQIKDTHSEVRNLTDNSEQWTLHNVQWVMKKCKKESIYKHIREQQNQEWSAPGREAGKAEGQPQEWCKNCAPSERLE